VALLLDRLSGEGLRRHLLDCDLPVPLPADLLRLEALLMNSGSPKMSLWLCDDTEKTTRALTKEHKALITQFKVEEYFDPKSGFEYLLGLMDQDEVRMIIEVFMTAGMSLDEIAGLLKERYNAEISTGVLVQYRKYFYNTSVMDAYSWHHYFQKRPPFEASVKLLALTDPENISRLKWRMHIPVKVEYTEMLENIRQDSYFRLEEEMTKPAPDLKRGTQLLSMMVNAGDREERFRKPDEQTQLEKFRIHVERVKREDIIQMPISVTELPGPDERQMAVVGKKGGKLLRPEFQVPEGIPVDDEEG
jgi:hypothetical protein